MFSSGDDPVGLGLVESLNRPGGNVTGAFFLTSSQEGKRLELLHRLVPTAALIGVLVNPNGQASVRMEDATVINLKTAKALGIEVPVELLALADEVAALCRLVARLGPPGTSAQCPLSRAKRS